SCVNVRNADSIGKPRSEHDVVAAIGYTQPTDRKDLLSCMVRLEGPARGQHHVPLLSLILSLILPFFVLSPLFFVFLFPHFLSQNLLDAPLEVALASKPP